MKKEYSWVKQICCALLIYFAGVNAFAKTIIKVGYFPNVTHAQALLMQSFIRENNEQFQIQGITIEWKSYNAGGSAMEDLVNDKIDLAYVGPVPALKTFINQKENSIKVLIGAARGGSSLVVKKNSGLKNAKDLKGKKIATPEYGNTQDVACRNWLVRSGLKVGKQGDVIIIPIPNPKQLAHFKSGEVDAVWGVEPWISRLEVEGNGEIIYTEPIERSIVTVLTANDKMVKKQLPILRKFVDLHKKIVQWMNHHPKEAQKRVEEEIVRTTQQTISPKIVKLAWDNIVFISYIASRDFENSFDAIKRSGFLSDVEKETVQFDNILLRRNLLN